MRHSSPPLRGWARLAGVLRTGSAVLLLMVLSACGGGGGGSNATPAPPAITSFSGSLAIVTAGTPVNLTGVFANGTGMIMPGSLGTASGATQTVTPADTTTYTLIVTNDGGTKVSQTVTVTVVAAPAVPAITAPAYATAGSTGLLATVPAQGGSSYAWSISGGSITDGAGSNQVTFTAGTAGTVQLGCVVTNAAGTASALGSAVSTIVAVPALPVINAPAYVTAGSTGLLASVPAQGGSSYAWNLTNGSITAGIGTDQVTFTAGTTGTVQLTCVVTSAAGLDSAKGSAISTIVALPVISTFTAAKSPITSGTATTLSAVFSGVTGSIDLGIGTVTTGVAVPTGKLSANSTYTLTVTNAAGASVTAQAVVAVVPAPSITGFDAGATTITAGGTTSLTGSFTNGTGVITPGNLPVTSGAPATVSPAQTTTYTLTVTNTLGASVIAQVPVAVLPAPAIGSFIASSSPIVAGTATTLTAVFSGGTGSIDHGIGPVATGVAVPTGTLSAGLTYTLTVTNTLGASVTAQAAVAVTAAPPPGVTKFKASPASAGPGASVTLDAAFTGGTGVINPGAISLAASGSVTVAPTVSTNYVLTVTNPGGVTATASTRVVVGALGNFAGTPSGAGNTVGTGGAARLYGPAGSAYDASGNLYVTDQYNHVIRKIDGGNGAVTVLAGTLEVAGSADGVATGARFNSPTGIAVAPGGTYVGNIFVADTGNSLIRMVDPTNGTVTTFAGTDGSAGYFNDPQGLAVDSAGTVWVADTNNNTIRKITIGGAVSTFAGITGTAGHADSTNPLTATFNHPCGVAVDLSSGPTAGNIYVADSANNIIRLITPAGVVSTYACVWSSGTPGNSDGNPGQFWNPMGVAVDGAGFIYVADTSNQMIRTITPPGVSYKSVAPYVLTLVGHNTDSNYLDGIGVGTEFSGPFELTPTANGVYFNYPTSVALNASGTNLVVSDSRNNAVRVIPIAAGNQPSCTTISLTVAGFAHWASPGWLDSGFTYPLNYPLSGPIPPRFSGPVGLTLDAAGNIYVADSTNNAIRKITPVGFVSTFAGTPAAGHPGTVPVSGLADGAATTAAQFSSPGAVAADTSGILYVADTGNNKVRMIAGGTVSTVASGLNTPLGIAVDNTTLGTAGRVYVADTFHNVVQMIPPGGGAMTILAGSASFASGSANGIGTLASFNLPGGIAVDNSTLPSAGTIYLADTYNNLIRKISMPDGSVSTLAGSGTQGNADGTGAAAEFNHPGALAVDPATGNVYVADTYNQVVRMIVPGTGVVTTLVGVAGTGIFPAAFPAALPASLAFPFGIAVAPGLTLGGVNPGGSLLISVADAVLTAPF